MVKKRRFQNFPDESSLMLTTISRHILKLNNLLRSNKLNLDVKRELEKNLNELKSQRANLKNKIISNKLESLKKESKIILDNFNNRELLDFVSEKRVNDKVTELNNFFKAIRENTKK